MRTLSRVVLIAGLAATPFAGPPVHADVAKPGAQRSASTHAALGSVTQIDRAAATVTIAHEPVASLGWPAMTMAFKVADAKLLERFIVGRQVVFEFIDRGGSYEISNAIPLEARGAALAGRSSGGHDGHQQGMGGHDMQGMHDMCMGMMAGDGSQRRWWQFWK